MCWGRLSRGPVLELGLEGVGISWMREGKTAEGQGGASEGTAGTKATRPMWGDARVSRAACMGVLGDKATVRR